MVVDFEKAVGRLLVLSYFSAILLFRALLYSCGVST